MKQKITLIFFFTGLVISATGQNSFEKQFVDLYHKKDTAAEKKILVQWQSNKPKDPELFVAYFNYYVQKSTMEENSIQQKDSIGKDLKKAFEYINKGIALFPNRLDMRFGKIYMLGQKEKYNEFTNEIIKTISYSDTNKNAWVWIDNDPPKEPKKFMLSSIQEYIVQLSETGNSKLLEDVKRISEAVLKYYPDNIEFLLDLSSVYIVKKDYDKALQQLLKAEKFEPTNSVVLSNIAEVYKRKGDNANAIIYYEKVMKYGDDATKADAKKKLDELKKK